MGSGRGAVLTMVARLIPRGKAVGLDLWKSADQSGNTLDAARRNAERESVVQRVDLVTGDMTAMPFEPDSFDLVLSALAIHNITNPAGRRKAIDEYSKRLRELGATDVTARPLDWRYWYGGPWTAPSSAAPQNPSVSEMALNGPGVVLGRR